MAIGEWTFCQIIDIFSQTEDDFVCLILAATLSCQERWSEVASLDGFANFHYYALRCHCEFLKEVANTDEWWLAKQVDIFSQSMLPLLKPPSHAASTD